MRRRTLVFWSRCFTPLLGLAFTLLCLWSFACLAVSAQSDQPLADLQVEKSTEGSLFPADGPLVFAISVRNVGEGAAQAVRLRDLLPANTAYLTDTSGAPVTTQDGELVWDLGALESGASQRFYLLLRHQATPGDTLHNQVSVSGLNEGDTSNNSASADALIGEGQPDLRVAAWCNPLDPTPGETFVFGIEYGNDESIGTGAATLTFTLPASTTLVSWSSEGMYGLWSQVRLDASRLVLTVPAVPGNWDDTLQVRLRLQADAPMGAELRGAVDLAVAGDANATNNHADAYVRADVARPDGAVRLEFSAGRWVPGGYAEFDAWYGNEGNTTLHMSLTDTLPADTRFQSFRLQLTGDVYQTFAPARVDEHAAFWDIPALEPGVWWHGRLRLSILSGAAPGSVLANCLESSIAALDIRPFNDQACFVAAVQPAGPDLSAHGSSGWDDESRPSYEIAFENVGSVRLDGVCFTVTYPLSTTWTGILYSWGPSTQVTHDPRERRLVVCLSEVAPGANGGFGFPLRLDPSLVWRRGLSFTCTVEASAPGDVYPADNRLELTAYSGPDVYVRQWLSDGLPTPGEVVTFTVEFGNRNRWWGTQSGLHITDTLPAGMEFVRAWQPNDWASEWNPDSSSGGNISWSWGPAQAEDRWAFRIAARITDTQRCGTQVLTNKVEAYSDNPTDIEFLQDNNVSALPIQVPGTPCRLFLPVLIKARR